ncbi:MAG: hypothetical protein ACR2QZ_14435 [Woeseiaceae bacterium]
MSWDAVDFAVFGLLLVSVGVIYWLAVRFSANTAYRSAVGVAMVTAFFLIWVNGAVGIIGDEGNDANMMFFGVIAVGAIGALIARFQAKGMARALLATAIAQTLVTAIALAGDLGSTGPVWPLDALILTGFFAALWLVSAWLFKNAARKQRSNSVEPDRNAMR